jgi:hypothetical protein
MKKNLRVRILGLIAMATLTSVSAFAATQHVRLEQQFGMTGQLAGVLRVLAQNPKLPKLTTADFLEVENTTLANYRFATHLQLFQGSPIHGAMIRTWENLETGHLVLMDAHIDDGAAAAVRLQNLRNSRFLSGNRVLSHNDLKLAKAALAGASDTKIVRVNSQNEWNGSDLERVILVSGKRGVHKITYSNFTGQLKSRTYREFPQDDIVAQVFPIYEESEKTHVMQHRIPVILKNILPMRKNTAVDPYAALKERTLLESKIDDVKAATPEGEAEGYWSMASLKNLIASIQKNLVSVPNTFANGGVYLDGKYATVSIHPDATKLPGVTVPLVPSEQVFFNWKTVGDGPDNQIFLVTPFKSQPLVNESSALERPARRLPDHDPAGYINDGFDEIQVYYAIDTLMESLHAMGFNDPELSTRPFHAFLFNPDIEMRDNAFYTDDTINFTTYSPEAQNYARDNSTIWHELGHGVMDRLMGNRITLADSGGLSEGMADFVAQLIIQDKTDGKPFDGSEDLRIINNTGFNLTNESHDDGEAYGGSMRDLMVLAVKKEGHAGLVKVTDLTLDAMRLARNHPALTANDWFESILFADRLGHKGMRAPGEMSDLVTQALNHRNYRFDHGAPADLKVVTEDGVLTNETKGSRYNPYRHTLKEGESVSHDIQISLTNSDTYKFIYPVTVEVQFNGGPLQGAVKWEDEAAGSKTFVLNSEADIAKVKLTALSGCDSINREDGSCQDFAYILIKNAGETRPVAKKRFYVRIAAPKDGDPAQGKTE